MLGLHSFMLLWQVSCSSYSHMYVYVHPWVDATAGNGDVVEFLLSVGASTEVSSIKCALGRYTQTAQECLAQHQMYTASFVPLNSCKTV